MIKFKLYTTLSGWNNKHEAVKAELDLPAHMTAYAIPAQVKNESHADFGKYVFPVKLDGNWKCDQLFKASDLVEHDWEWLEQKINE